MIPDAIIREKHGRGKEQGRFQDGISAPGVSKEATPLGWCGEKLKPMFAGRLAVVEFAAPATDDRVSFAIRSASCGSLLRERN